MCYLIPTYSFCRSMKKTSIQSHYFYGQFHYLFSYNLPALLLCLSSLNSKVLIHTLVGTHISSGFDTLVQLPVMHLPRCKCQNTAAERLSPCTAGIITLQSASALFTPWSLQSRSREVSHIGHRNRPLNLCLLGQSH